MNTTQPLTFRTPIRDPITVASLLAMGLTIAFGLHALLVPQYRDIDFTLFLYCQAAFIAYSVCYIILLRFRWKLSLREPPAPGGPEHPLEGAPVPVPVGPPTPAMTRSDAKEMPRPVAEKSTPMVVRVERETIGEPASRGNR